MEKAKDKQSSLRVGMAFSIAGLIGLGILMLSLLASI